ncbi:TorF family putative porin [Zhongshania sp.]|uniref:TorF family putative porin n=1 Tax=Zhongshania sp. TaxID=1971902 RepID=UPI0035627945
MKTMKTLLAAGVAAASMTMIAAPAVAEVSASAGVASSYLWRGYDLGSGTPAVYGDINYSAAGFTTGVWVSSGDTAAGTEYDLYADYTVDLGGVSVSAGVINYVYATGAGYLGAGNDTDFGDHTDAYLGLGLGPVAFTAYKQIAGGTEEYTYYTLSYDIGKFSFLLGTHESIANGATLANGKIADGESESHLNVTYSYNDNLSFTVSQFVDGQENVDAYAGSGDDDMKFVVSYDMPISM